MCLGSTDINEMVIGRLIDHCPKTVTERYDSVDINALRRALEQLNEFPTD